MTAHSNSVRQQGKKIVFVPTMGFLHEGHLSLMDEAKKHGDHLVVSIFVNPTQFGENEDLDNYPSNLERDFSLCEQRGADVVFTPNKDSMYGENYQTYVTLENLPNHLCGLSRPGHFRGVATVVTKLFNMVLPHVAVFGQKDFQQVAVLRQMTMDLDFDIQIIGCPTVRESDGLAMSSRNSYLSDEERKTGLVLYQALSQAQDQVRAGEKDAKKILDAATELISSRPGTRIDYAALCDPVTLDDLTTINGPALFALAVFVGATRLIDNMVLGP